MIRRRSPGPGARLVLVLVAASVAACSSTKVVPLAAVTTRQHDELSSPAGLRVEGYVTRDGARHDLPSYAIISPDGAVSFQSIWDADEAPGPVLRCRPGEVTALLVWQQNQFREVAGAVGRGVITGVAIVLVVAVVLVLNQYADE